MALHGKPLLDMKSSAQDRMGPQMERGGEKSFHKGLHVCLHHIMWQKRASYNKVSWQVKFPRGHSSLNTLQSEHCVYTEAEFEGKEGLCTRRGWLWLARFTIIILPKWRCRDGRKGPAISALRLHLHPDERMRVNWFEDKKLNYLIIISSANHSSHWTAFGDSLRHLL